LRLADLWFALVRVKVGEITVDYYTKHANENIGWMNTVADVIPELYKSGEKKEDEKDDKIGLMNRVQLDLFSFEFLEISPALDGLLKVFIPITQLIPQNSELDLQEIDIDSDKINDLRMVPLPNFTTANKRILLDVNEDISLNILCENPSIGAVMNWMWHSSKSYWHRTLQS
ncbi:9531_t:CDS:2, partial [Racocetra persica]